MEFKEANNKPIPADLFIDFLQTGISVLFPDEKAIEKISKDVELTEDIYLENYELFKSFGIAAPQSDSIDLLDEVNKIENIASNTYDKI